MRSAVPLQSAHNMLSQWASRNWAIVDLVVAASFRVVWLPPIFKSMGTRDIRLGDRVSLVFLLWFVLADIASVVILRARSQVVRDADGTTARLLDWFRRVIVPLPPQTSPAA